MENHGSATPHNPGRLFPFATGWTRNELCPNVVTSRLLLAPLYAGTSGHTQGRILAWAALARRFGDLALAATARVFDAGSVKRGAPTGTDWGCREVADEVRALALPAGRYVRLPVTDHARPSDGAVERLLEVVRGLGQLTHIHVHCRGGKGRTATLMCMLDMIRTAARLPRATIFARQSLLGEYDLRQPADPASKKAPYIAERRAFLDRFYDYARTNPDGRPLGWTQWLAARTLRHDGRRWPRRPA